MASDDRVTSGIPGFDKLVEGGFVKNSINLLAGGAGTGKTIFGFQFVLEGLKKGENCVYITLEQRVDDLLSDMGRFGWGQDLKKYSDSKKLTIASQFPASVAELKNSIFDMLDHTKAQRFVLDSLSVATMGWKESDKDLGKMRRDVFDFFNSLKKTGVTSLLISEIPEAEEKKLSRFGFEEFVADGIIKMHYVGIGGQESTQMQIRKMRRTNHSRGFHSLFFTKNGLAIKGEEISVLMQ